MSEREMQSDEPAAAPELPVYGQSELASLTVDELVERLIQDEDRAPRALIDACAARGEAMLDLLASLVAPDRRWNDDEPDGEWWLRLHAVMILGLIADERSARLLVSFMRRMERANDENLQEWLSGYWPALFRNKPDGIERTLRELAQDRSVDWYMRAEAVEAVLARGAQQGEARLDEALDWAAAIAADESEDWDVRLCAAGDLLDFPRPRHRAVLDGLAKRQRGLGAHFSSAEVRKAYAQAKDEPQWKQRDDPWKFYSPAEIAKRQQRWAQEAAAADEEFDDEPFTEPVIPFIREAPKVGRNDPCPCGSGKKYKRCCLDRTDA
jgi:hypothetical protein